MDKSNVFIYALTSIAVVSTTVCIVLIFLIFLNLDTFNRNQVNTKVLEFRNTFENYFVLSAQTISFDERIALEAAARGLDDKEIFSQWERFSNSTTKQQATQEAKSLLSLLIKKTVR